MARFQPYADVHNGPEGSEDRRPSAIQVLKDCNAVGGLRGKVVVCTGCSSGLGVQTARALYEGGATLVLTARNTKKLESVIEEIVTTSPQYKDAQDRPPRPIAVQMHLDSLNSVRLGAAEIKGRVDKVDVLIKNAGVMACPYTITEDGFELQIGTNHFAQFLLFHELLPLLLKAATPEHPARVVMVTSEGHFITGVNLDNTNFSNGKTYDKWLGYGQSKTANIYMANYINRHYASQNLVGLSVHPGVILTECGRHMTDEDHKFLESQGALKAVKDIPQGAATTVWAAVSPHFNTQANGGQYLGDIGVSERFAPHAFNEEAEDELWKLSCEAVGLTA